MAVCGSALLPCFCWLNQADQGSSRTKQAVGVLAHCTATTSTAAPADGQPAVPVMVHAPVVVSSCGSIHTPALLLRSGITVGGQVGCNMRLHPASGVVAQFPQTQEQRQAGKGAVEMYEVR